VLKYQLIPSKTVGKHFEKCGRQTDRMTEWQTHRQTGSVAIGL